MLEEGKNGWYIYQGLYGCWIVCNESKAYDPAYPSKEAAREAMHRLMEEEECRQQKQSFSE